MTRNPVDETARILTFAQHIEARVPGASIGTLTMIVRGILADPQEHIDALVEAGVLDKRRWFSDEPHDAYRVVLPHKHAWFVRGVAHGKHGEVDAEVFVKCDCGQGRWIPNRPIEIPS